MCVCVWKGVITQWVGGLAQWVGVWPSRWGSASVGGWVWPSGCVCVGGVWPSGWGVWPSRWGGLVQWVGGLAQWVGGLAQWVGGSGPVGRGSVTVGGGGYIPQCFQAVSGTWMAGYATINEIHDQSSVEPLDLLTPQRNCRNQVDRALVGTEHTQRTEDRRKRKYFVSLAYSQHHVTCTCSL